MIGTLPHSRVASHFSPARSPVRPRQRRILRYSLVLFLVLFGLAKFTEAEALTIQPWVANSPFLGWLYAITSVQGGIEPDRRRRAGPRRVAGGSTLVAAPISLSAAWAPRSRS